MNKFQLIRNATIVNEGETFIGSVLIKDKFIQAIYTNEADIQLKEPFDEIDAKGYWLLPGVIDEHVHFREPGLTYKGDLSTESKAAVAGGVTSFMDMPNTIPPTTTIEALEQKFQLASEKSLANYSFYLGVTNDNFEELKKADIHRVCGIKIFLGSSTGNLLVDNELTLERIFAEIPFLIAVHCEDEQMIQQHIRYYQNLIGEELPIFYHPLIRDTDVCYRATTKAVKLAEKYQSRLHVLHVSTEKEISLFSSSIPLNEKKITAETCIHYLWFSDEDYEQLGNSIKCNPAIKSKDNRSALRKAINDNRLDVVATDHAPHLWNEKEGSCLKAASGAPFVQHSLTAMLQLVKEGIFTLEKVVEKMCHAPAVIYKIQKRGFIRPGYYADLVLINPSCSWQVSPDNLLCKCGWSSFTGTKFDSKVVKTWVNGHKVYDEGYFDESIKGEPLIFDN
ncbi:MAG TPA: dihydroorotase [Paludibacteraceae bacterium]|nr:dihydroorotase [Paludibacteraceae bacterium]